MTRILFLSMLLVVIVPPPAGAEPTSALAKRALVDEMVLKHGFDRVYLEQLLVRTNVLRSILNAIAKPAEKKSWYQYRGIFLTPERADNGMHFWRDHGTVLARTQQVYGTLPQVVVAIIGVETFYGRHAGKYRVLDALSTLAFHYPKRAEFFQDELKHFLLLTREQNIDPFTLTGSYAGAMGMPQFISSSYRNYAVDFDKDGRIDIWNNAADAIGSVANYLSAHGWEPGAPIAIRAAVTSADAARKLVDKGLKPHLAWSQLAALGITPSQDLPGDPLVSLIALENESGMEYWLGLQNFYVITRYNHSELYAMAVTQLAKEIHARHLTLTQK